MAESIEKGFIRLTEISVTYLGTGVKASIGRQWTKLTGGVTYNMALQRDRDTLVRLWRDLRTSIVDGIERKENIEEVKKRFIQLERAMRACGWEPSQTVPSPESSSTPLPGPFSPTPQPSIAAPTPQPSTPQPPALPTLQSDTPQVGNPPKPPDVSQRTRSTST